MDRDISEDEKIQETVNVFQNFMDSLGPNDIYKRIFLEVFLEEIYGKKVDLSDVFKIDNEK